MTKKIIKCAINTNDEVCYLGNNFLSQFYIIFDVYCNANEMLLRIDDSCHVIKCFYINYTIQYMKIQCPTSVEFIMYGVVCLALGNVMLVLFTYSNLFHAISTTLMVFAAVFLMTGLSGMSQTKSHSKQQATKKSIISMFDIINGILVFLHLRKTSTWTCGTTYRHRYECMGAMTLVYHKIVGRTQLNLLDAGCSNGTATKDCMSFLSNLGYKVSLIGVDRDEERIREAQKDNNGIEFICDDLKRLRFENQFDVILCLNVIRRIERKSKKEILQNIAQMLKPNGVLITGIDKKDMKRMNLPVLEPPNCSRHKSFLFCKRPCGKGNDTRIISRNKVKEYANLCS